ncbi:hypothetical protein BKA70DRAFT_1528602 [Coprinopsis sp. MPI-PUGE-AT-0042]|nr:hypothetical protein BKA70DRAFT_1528602 [Coprinopsis sp. MPI-PUGE-AT-0042]
MAAPIVTFLKALVIEQRFASEASNNTGISSLMQPTLSPIANEGEGQLALSENGFRAFAVGSPDPDPAAGPPAVVQASSSLPKATIAGSRLGRSSRLPIPMRDGICVLRLSSSTKTGEGTNVVAAKMLQDQGTATQNHDTRNLGIDFAHSPEENGQAQMHEKTLPARQHSTDETESSPQSTNRSLSSIAFRASRMVRKPFERWGKTYTAATSSSANDNPQERSWSPSYQINLPFQPPLVRAQDTNADLGSEFYPAPPPSYAASVMSNARSRRCPSTAQALARKQKTGGGLLAVPRPSYGGSDADIDVNTPPLALRGFSQEDRGSVHEHESGDEDPRVLGTNSERYVLRSLSPRTSRATPSLSVPPPKRKKAPEEPRRPRLICQPTPFVLSSRSPVANHPSKALFGPGSAPNETPTPSP